MALKNPLWKDKTEEKTTQAGHARPNSKTKLTIKYDCGFPNILTIRGSGLPHLSWEKGIPLKNIKADEWVFETDAPFNKIEYKILINDKVYENGPNRTLAAGINSNYTPNF
jgi:hypothetical protein